MTGAIIRRLAICTVALGLIVMPKVASAQTGGVKGKVVDAQGNAVEGAEVAILSLDKGGKPLTVKTKKDGTYMQVGLSPGGYKMTVTKGDLSASQDNVHIPLDIKEQNFTLGKGGGAREGSKEDAAKAKAKSEAANKAFSEGVAAMNEQKYDDAITKFQEVIAVVPNCPECYANIGTAQSALKKYDEAEASYKKAIEIKADMAEAYNGLANLYNAQKKFDQAAEASKKAMELSQATGAPGAAGGAPGAAAGGPSASAIYNQGVILWNAGKIAEAKAQFEQAVKLDPNNADAHYWLGMSFVNGGDLPKAKPEFETYLKLAPTGQYADTAKAVLSSIK